MTLSMILHSIPFRNRSWTLCVFVLLLLTFATLPANKSEARQSARPGVAPGSVVGGLSKLVTGDSWTYVYNRPTPRFRSRIKVTFLEKSEGFYIFETEGTHRVDSSFAERIDAAEAAGRVQVLSKRNGVYKTRRRTVLDSSGRLIEAGTVTGREFYSPHNCQRVAGTCRYSITYEETDRRLFLVRVSRFIDGVWHSVVSLDPTRDPAGRSQELEKTQISYAADGIVKDSIRERSGRHYSSLVLR